MKLILLLLVAMMALFSSLALAGPNKGPSKYAKNAAKSKGQGV
jgi:predicted secreted protein